MLVLVEGEGAGQVQTQPWTDAKAARNWHTNDQCGIRKTSRHTFYNKSMLRLKSQIEGKRDRSTTTMTSFSAAEKRLYL